jgi:hypothetical protein
MKRVLILSKISDYIKVLILKEDGQQQNVYGIRAGDAVINQFVKIAKYGTGLKAFNYLRKRADKITKLA